MIKHEPEALLIGGPLDGQKHRVREGQSFLQAREAQAIEPSCSPDEGIDEQTLVESLVTYSKRDVMGVSLWAPVHMSSADLIRRLLAHYETRTQV